MANSTTRNREHGGSASVKTATGVPNNNAEHELSYLLHHIVPIPNLVYNKPATQRAPTGQKQSPITTEESSQEPQRKNGAAGAVVPKLANATSIVRSTPPPLPNYYPHAQRHEKDNLSKQKSTEIIGQSSTAPGYIANSQGGEEEDEEQGKTHEEEEVDLKKNRKRSSMVEDNFGAMQNFRRRNHNSENENNVNSSYLILSPSNPFRIFAISFLTHWIYSTVILLTISAFVLSSVYCTYYKKSEISEKSSILQYTRCVLVITILMEILIKIIARGLITQKFSFLRLKWDWLDVISLVFLFVSIVIPWKTLEFFAAAVVLLKLIPIHPGSITAFILLCSSAKKLIPVLFYAAVIVWIYGVIIFTLFVKYQHQPNDDGDVGVEDQIKSVRKLDESGRDNWNDNITRESSVLEFVENVQQNSTSGLSVECLPANFRSLSGSFIQAIRMLTLHYSSGENFLISNITLQSSCQLETFTLSILETLIIISGTLPIISMSFAILCHLFQKSYYVKSNRRQGSYDIADGDGDEHYNHNDSRRRTISSIKSSSRSHSHDQGQLNTNSQETFCHIGCLNGVANAFCDCDYYFCCLANLQRRLYPLACRILKSKIFKIFILLIVSIDFSCMAALLWFPTFDIVAQLSPLFLYCIQTCFIVYTIEAVFRWFAISSDEYWMNVWSAFDLTVVLLYWIGYTLINVFSFSSWCYIALYGVLMIRMLKIVPYWKSLDITLKLTMSCVFSNRHSLLVILICSFSAVLFKFAVLTLESKGISQIFPVDLITLMPLDYRTFVDSIFSFVLGFFFTTTTVVVFMKTFETLNNPDSESCPPKYPAAISLLLNHNDNYVDDLHHTEPRRSFNDSSPINVMPFPNGINHLKKYKMAPSPSDTNELLSPESRSMLSPSSDVLSPLLSIPIPNGLNGHAHMNENNPDLDNVPLTAVGTNRARITSASKSYSPQDVLNWISAAVVLISSINIILDSSQNNVSRMNWYSIVPGCSLWIESGFILLIGIHVIYRTRLNIFSRETFLQICCCIDVVVISAAAIEVFSSGMEWVPTRSGTTNVLHESAKAISACRGLLIFSRISWLQRVGSALCYELGKVLKYLAAFSYFWLTFIVSFTELQKMFTGCSKGIPPPGSETISNITQPNNTFTSTTTTTTTDTNFKMSTFLVTLTLFLFLLNVGILLGILRHRLGDSEKLFKKVVGVTSKLQRPRNRRSQVAFADLEDMGKPTEGTCVPIMYFVSNHRNFDIIVMAVIFFDALGITFEYFATSERSLILRKHYTAYMLFIYGIELSSKMIGNGLQFFKSNWNMFDCIIMGLCSTDFFLSLVYDHWIIVLVQNVRFLRILRIFQFHPFVKRAKIIGQFFSSLQQCRSVIWNHAIFYIFVYIAVLIYRFKTGNSDFFCMENAFYINDPPTFSLTSWVAAPFKEIFYTEGVFVTFGNPAIGLDFKCIVYNCGLLLFSLIRISIIFNACLILIIILSQYLLEEELANFKEIRVDEHCDNDDKSSYMIPCISPETVDIETTSSAGNSSRFNNNPSRCLDVEQNCLFDDGSGCKVFFVEAMITTV